jgi:hypothetical protein
MFVIGCTSTKVVVEPPAELPVETVTPPPVVDQASIQAMGPPPGYVKPENYWVREKIILGEVPTIIEREVPLSSEPAPQVPATQ